MMMMELEPTLKTKETFLGMEVWGSWAAGASTIP
jgi:hypothetical protein